MKMEVTKSMKQEINIKLVCQGHRFFSWPNPSKGQKTKQVVTKRGIKTSLIFLDLNFLSKPLDNATTFCYNIREKGWDYKSKEYTKVF